MTYQNNFIMKYFLIGFIALFIFTGEATAQSVNIGAKGGLNVYNVSGGSQYGSRIGMHIGALGHIHLTDQFALQPELYYSGQGTKIETTDTKLNLNYINVPVLLQYMFDNGFRVQAGPQVGFLASAKSKTGDVTVNVMDDFKTVDLGLGIGASYINPATSIGIDFRYNHGLSNIATAPDSDSKHRGFQVGLFYLFQHKH
jgi:hypothetical protein